MVVGGFFRMFFFFARGHRDGPVRTKVPQAHLRRRNRGTARRHLRRGHGGRGPQALLLHLLHLHAARVRPGAVLWGCLVCLSVFLSMRLCFIVVSLPVSLFCVVPYLSHTHPSPTRSLYRVFGCVCLCCVCYFFG